MLKNTIDLKNWIFKYFVFNDWFDRVT